MHALKRFGTAFGGYKMMDNYPVPECGPDDIILEIKAAAICGADMKHWGVDNGYDDTNCEGQQQSVRGHEFAGEIVKVGENVKTGMLVRELYQTTVPMYAAFARLVRAAISFAASIR